MGELKAPSTYQEWLESLKWMESHYIHEEDIERIGEGNIPQRGLILENFQKLSESGVPFVVRVPLIPGVTDTVENLSEIAERVQQSAALGVELLPYNKMAGSKYALIGKAYDPLFDEKREPNIDTAIFCEKGIAVKVM